jgi:hypothetical protein
VNEQRFHGDADHLTTAIHQQADAFPGSLGQRADLVAALADQVRRLIEAPGQLHPGRAWLIEPGRHVLLQQPPLLQRPKVPVDRAQWHPHLSGNALGSDRLPRFRHAGQYLENAIDDGFAAWLVHGCTIRKNSRFLMTILIPWEKVYEMRTSMQGFRWFLRALDRQVSEMCLSTLQRWLTLLCMGNGLTDAGLGSRVPLSKVR